MKTQGRVRNLERLGVENLYSSGAVVVGNGGEGGSD